MLGVVPGGGERVGQLLGELADVDGEMAALLARVLVGAERTMNLMVDHERVRRGT